MERALDRLSPDERASFVKGMTFLEAELNADADDVQPKELQRTASQPKRL